MFKCAQTNLFNKSKIIPTKKTTCDICLEEFKNIKNTPCKVCKKNSWYICNNCYQKNKELNGKCPVCRTEYVSIDIIEEVREPEIVYVNSYNFNFNCNLCCNNFLTFLGALLLFGALPFYTCSGR